MSIETIFGSGLTLTATKTVRLKVIRPVYESLAISEGATRYFRIPPTFSSAAEISSWFDFLRRESKEFFLALHLDNKNRILCLEIVSIGSLTAAVVHPREVYKSALLSSAASVIFLHNHVSGGICPSREDLDITQRLKEAGELLGIRVHDHLILGDGFYSFADAGLL